MAWRAAIVLLTTACGAGMEVPGVTAPVPLPAAGRLAEPPTIVLITLDTLRYEHLGCYGYFRDTTPNIDALAGEGLLFERAVASMASTLPSHLTMLTGLYPHQHGMNSNRRSASVPYTSELGRLSAAVVLRAAGYRTAAFVSASPLSTTTGVQAGFEHFSALGNSKNGSRQSAADTNELALPWLEEEGSKPGPLFLWVHYFDPHEPSNPRPPYDRRYRTDAAQRAWIRARGIDPAALEARYAHSARVRAHFLRNDPNRREDAAAEPLRVTLESIAELMNRYDGELRFLDDQIGILLAALRKVGRYEDALLALVADHGQSLGENAWLGHGTITNVNAFVPLILRLPRGLVPQPQRLTTLVSLADLMPTLLGRFELPDSELLLGQFEGEDLLSGHFVRGSALVERTSDELADGETGPQFALLSEHWKFIHRPKGRDELYDLADAGEFVDVSGDHPEVAARLRTEIASLLARRPALLERESAVDEELLRSLDELGYGGEDE